MHRPAPRRRLRRGIRPGGRQAPGALSLVSAACLSFALGLFFLNSFPVWADNLNGITMYASRGGLAPVVAIAAVMLACILAEIVSCFLSRGKGDAK